MRGYSVFGLRLGASHRLPGLTPAAGGAPWDIVVRLGARPPAIAREPSSIDPLYVSDDRDEAGRPLLVVRRVGPAGLFWLRYADDTDFVVDHDGTEIWGCWPEPWTVDDAATYLVGPVLAFALRRRGVTCLHASAVALGTRAVVLVGPAGAGKSTLAAGFARRHVPVLSDDVVALDQDGGTFRVRPGPPRIRLWPESVTALYGAPDALPRLTPTWDKRCLDLRTRAAQPREPLPVAAIYVVSPGEDPEAPARVERLSMVERLLALVANTSTNYLLDEALRGCEFECLSEVVRRVPVRRLVRADDPGRVLDVCDMIVQDVQERDLHDVRV
jgi:hypothetical protein